MARLQKLNVTDQRRSDYSKYMTEEEGESEEGEEYSEDEGDQDSYYNNETFLHETNIRSPGTGIGPNKINSERRKTTEADKSSYVIFWSVLLVVGLAAIFIPYFLNIYDITSLLKLFSKDSKVYACDNVTFIIEEINKMKEEFTSQSDDTWATFASGILRLFANDPTEPAAFLMFHEDDRTIECLVKKLSDFAAKCFNGNATAFSLDGVHLNDETFLQDSGELIKQYKSEIIDKKVMIINGLNDVPAKVAQEFHYFCDVYQPLVHNAVYFFILKKDITSTKTKKLIENVSQELKYLWNTLEYNKLDPLIARITTNVLPVHTERSIGWC